MESLRVKHFQAARANGLHFSWVFMARRCIKVRCRPNQPAQVKSHFYSVDYSELKHKKSKSGCLATYQTQYL
jgi:hypothetical protein